MVSVGATQLNGLGPGVAIVAFLAGAVVGVAALVTATIGIFDGGKARRWAGVSLIVLFSSPVTSVLLVAILLR